MSTMNPQTFASSEPAAPANGTMPPDAEVLERPRRRRFSAEYRLRILRQADACTMPGELGALLRREGLYSSSLANWRRQRDRTGVVFLGLDTPSPHRTESRHLHETLFLGEMVLAECLVRLGDLRRDEVLLIALPLPLSGLDGSPTRIVAVDAASAALQAWAHL
jgi:transposase-like protein